MSEEFISFGMKDYVGKESSPLDIQVGGAHYKGCGMQPIELSEGVRMYPSTSSILRYVVRHKDKNGAQDLKKALHYIDFLEKYDNWYAGAKFTKGVAMNEMPCLFYKFIKLNPQLSVNQIHAILAILRKDINFLRESICKEIEENYPQNLTGK